MVHKEIEQLAQNCFIMKKVLILACETVLPVQLCLFCSFWYGVNTIMVICCCKWFLFVFFFFHFYSQTFNI